jgi:hypothetical protein
MRSGYREAFDAVRVVERTAAPQLPVTARAIASAIPERIPVHKGVAKRLTKISVEAERDVGAAHPSAQVLVRSPFWHFLEYGTRFNPPYRPIETAIRSLGLRYVAR